MTNAHPLLAAVDVLTKPERSKVIQERNGITCITPVERPPLLTQMREAVWPSSNKDTGSSSSPSTRAPADVDALWEYSKMRTAIESWCSIAGVGVTRDSVVDLRRWHSSRLAIVEQQDTVDRFYINQLRKWETIIRKHLDPAKTFVLPVSCPVCGKREYGDEATGGGVFPIVVEYRKTDDDEAIRDEKATCRACATVWLGRDAIRELGDELKDEGMLA